ncbi:hypothetical protein [Hymenobacter elongatus]|uniref:Uncharacterized protein n=1 Tax=Hymenobacter elongatus TaxID=877208 RepID=A0A4Z0PIJ2_9BACT|nr:hypothetical protein [Hymenobacter elongatus]TGE15180.1 hypothetical protein E5J99_13305 [Hymenobacter elongatus]
MSEASSPADFLLSKTDAELLFLAQNPDFYHADLVAAAGRELRRRGVARAAEPPAAYYQDEDEAPARNWRMPAVGIGLLALAAILYFWPTGTKNWQNKQGPVAQRELVAVQTHVFPTFDSLTATQLHQMPRTLPAAERTDTTAQRKFLLLARRFWEAENQTDYLCHEVQAARIDSTFPGQVDITLDKWKRLTSALVYDHKLQPAMTARVELMRHAAVVRRETLAAMKNQYLYGQPPLDRSLLYLNDSVMVLRQTLLGVPASQRLRPRQEQQKRIDAERARQAIQDLPQV